MKPCTPLKTRIYGDDWRFATNLQCWMKCLFTFAGTVLTFSATLYEWQKVVKDTLQRWCEIRQKSIDTTYQPLLRQSSRALGQRFVIKGVQSRGRSFLEDSYSYIQATACRI